MTLTIRYFFFIISLPILMYNYAYFLMKFFVYIDLYSFLGMDCSAALILCFSYFFAIHTLVFIINFVTTFFEKLQKDSLG